MTELATRVFNDFDHDTRKWSQKVYTNNQFILLLSKNVQFNERLTDIYYPYDDIPLTKYRFNYPNFSHGDIYNVFRNLLLASNNMRFVILGDLKRDAGQIVNFDIGECLLHSQLQGSWIIYGCTHLWENHTYKNDISCFRTDAQISITE